MSKAIKKEATSFRLSSEALAIIRKQAQALGISQAAVIEMAVRKLKHSND